MEGVQIFVYSGKNLTDNQQDFDKGAISEDGLQKPINIPIDEQFFIAVIPKEGDEDPAFQFQFVTTAIIPDYIEQLRIDLGPLMFILLCASPLGVLLLGVGLYLYCSNRGTPLNNNQLKPEPTQDGNGWKDPRNLEGWKDSRNLYND